MIDLKTEDKKGGLRWRCWFNCLALTFHREWAERAVDKHEKSYTWDYASLVHFSLPCNGLVMDRTDEPRLVPEWIPIAAFQWVPEVLPEHIRIPLHRDCSNDHRNDLDSDGRPWLTKLCRLMHTSQLLCSHHVGLVLGILHPWQGTLGQIWLANVVAQDGVRHGSWKSPQAKSYGCWICCRQSSLDLTRWQHLRNLHSAQLQGTLRCLVRYTTRADGQS